MWQILQVTLISLVSSENLPGTSPKSYSDKEILSVYVNKLDSEKTESTFDYYYLPFCKPKHLEEADEIVEEILTGEDLEITPYRLNLNENKTCELLCEKYLDDKDIKNFKWMIDNQYNSNWDLDNLPAGYRFSSENRNINSFKSGIPLGFKGPKGYYVFNHLQFIVKVYEENSDQGKNWRIVGFLIQPLSISAISQHVCDDLTLIDFLKSSENYEEEILDYHDSINHYFKDSFDKIKSQLLMNKISFSYSVSFVPSKIPWASRWDNYLYKGNCKVRWISIISSFCMVIFLLIIIIHLFRLKVLREITIYNESIDEDQEIDSGWKQLRGDVFRPPRHVNLFCAGIGTGIQITLFYIFYTTFFIIGLFRPMLIVVDLESIKLFLFAFTGIFAGYVSGRFYKTLGGENWKVNSLTVSLMFPGLCFSILFCTSFLIWEEDSSKTMDILFFFKMLAIWFTLSLPLTLISTGLGYKMSPMKNPCHISRFPKPIPLWNNVNYYCFFLLAGSLPFLSMFIVLNYIMNSLWHFSLFYYLVGKISFCLIVIILTSAEVSILVTYIVLNREDYRWWWISFGVPGSSGVYLFLYKIYYYFNIFEYTGFYNTIMYFKSMILVSVGLGLITGTVGFLSTYFFIKKIFSLIESG